MAAVKGRPQRPHIAFRPRPDTRWQERSACLDTDAEAFFPTDSRTISVGARRICGGCEVRTQCLEYALAQGEWHGVWGGLSVDQRRELVRQRKTKRVTA